MLRWMIIGLLWACGGRDWYVATPKQIASIPTDGFFAMTMKASAGGRRPAPVRKVEARCVDTEICETRVLLPGADREFGEVQVLGKRQGSTTVVVDFENPFYGDRERRTIPVTVTPAPTRAALSLGAQLPDERALIHSVSGADAGHCTLDNGAWKSNVAGSERGDVRVYFCSAYVSFENQRRFRRCSGDEICSRDEQYLLCTQVRNGTVVATAVLNLDEKWKVKISEGTFDPGVCL